MQPKITRHVAEALMRIKHMPELESFRTWLAETVEAERTTLTKVVEIGQMQRSQGRAQAFGEIKDLIEQAPSLLEKVAANVRS